GRDESSSEEDKEEEKSSRAMKGMFVGS
ncbi:hypothetical protein A2U01_0073494, partial [Trifolium medium]|nr:hypothetical protein [Trifolium medium]